MSFWTNKEWLDKVKESDFEFYQAILDGKQIELENETFTLIIDGKRHPLSISDINFDTLIQDGKKIN